MATTRVFISNTSQAVRLPKALEFPSEIRDVAIRAVGQNRVISPAQASWDDFFDAEGVELGKRRKRLVARRSKP